MENIGVQYFRRTIKIFFCSIPERKLKKGRTPGRALGTCTGGQILAKQTFRLVKRLNISVTVNVKTYLKIDDFIVLSLH